MLCGHDVEAQFCHGRLPECEMIQGSRAPEIEE